jgi:RimJ/RimL family protein N-acetyltransferase
MLNSLPTVPEQLILRTARLDLIPINRDHAEPMFDIVRCPELYLFTGGEPPRNIEWLIDQYARWERRLSPDGAELWLNWVVSLRSEDQLIGHLQAGVSSEHADMAWVIAVQWQNRGIATEAATAVLEFLVAIGVRNIRASIHPHNIASVKLAERLGLRPTNERSNGERIWQMHL